MFLVWFISGRKVGFDLNKDSHGHAEILTWTGREYSGSFPALSTTLQVTRKCTTSHHVSRQSLGHVAKRKTKDLQFWRRDLKISRWYLENWTIKYHQVGVSWTTFPEKTETSQTGQGLRDIVDRAELIRRTRHYRETWQKAEKLQPSFTERGVNSVELIQ